jgi:electron transport complex protein RnfG
VRDYFRLIIVLGLISAVAGGTLALVNSFTEPKIAAYKQLAEAQAYQEALPSATTFASAPADLLAEVKKDPQLTGIADVKLGSKAGRPVGWVCKAAVRGYSSDLVLLVGIGADAKLGRVIVLEHNETPGLGAKVAEPEFIAQAAIRNSNPGQTLQVTKDGGSVQAVAGATISSRAALEGINQVLDLFKRYLQ